VHYFYPSDKNPNSKSKKQALVWNLEALRQWIRGDQIDSELLALLSR
jgi:hypothetical protein